MLSLNLCFFINIIYTIFNEYISQVAQKQRDKAHALNSKLRQQLSDYQVPAVMIYVNEKATLYDLKKICSSWERKVEIVEVYICKFINNIKCLIICYYEHNYIFIQILP